MTEGAIEFDAVLDLCRDRHRRIVLAVLAEERRSVPVHDLAKTILRCNHGVTEVSSEVLARIQVSLHHEHVPKLESAGVIEYDPDRKLVEPTERFDLLQPYLFEIVDLDPDLEVPMEL